MVTEESNKIGDMVLPMSLIMLADPLLSVCSQYAVRERFIRCTTLSTRRRGFLRISTPLPSDSVLRTRLLWSELSRKEAVDSRR